MVVSERAAEGPGAAQIGVGRLLRWLGGTPNRTFILYPAIVLLTRRRVAHPQFLPLLAWGYLQYRLIGQHRQRQRAGGRGFDRAPDRLLTTGPYAFSRNPMYLGHLIFMLGLALSTGSKLAWAILLANARWFQGRVLYDEARLQEKFGAEYEAYCRRVRRWL
jgi:protein-S-isoprenylcysteine O-methyltransferase Ste14